MDNRMGADMDTGATVVKAGSAWALVGITSWADAASALAALYTVILLCEWGWKRFGRRYAERRGWVKRRLRRSGDRARHGGDSDGYGDEGDA